MMDYERFAEIIAGDRGDDLDEAESRAFEQLLAEDPRCAELLAQAEEELVPLAAWEPPQPSPEQWARIGATLRAEMASAPPIRLGTPSRAPGYFLAAAAVLLFAGMGVLLGLGPGPGGGGLLSFMNPDGAEPPEAGPEDPGIVPPPGPEHDEPPPVAVALDVTGGEGFDAFPIDSDGLLLIVVREDS